jgi:hypothetical protein
MEGFKHIIWCPLPIHAVGKLREDGGDWQGPWRTAWDRFEQNDECPSFSVVGLFGIQGNQDGLS